MRSHGQQATTPATSTRARFARLAATCGLAICASACSVSYPLYGGQDDIKTGSIDQKPVAVPADAVVSSPLSPPPGATAAAPAAPGKPAAYVQNAAATAVAPEANRPAITPSDWAYARGALSLAMGSEAVNASVPWANPDTGAYGSFSASAATTLENGATCRPFSASHSGGGHEQRLEGTACRTAAGYWEAVALKATASRTL